MTRIYLDNAASTPLLPEVVEVMNKVLLTHYGNPSSIHTEGRSARALIEEARKKIAKHLNASISEIFFTSGGTESNNTAIKCSVRDLGVRRIISSSIEHHAVSHSIAAIAKEQKIEIVELHVDKKGTIDLNELEQILSSSTAPTLVSLMHINNELGNINPITEIGKLCKKYNALFHTDAVQSVGHLPIDLQKEHIDFLAASAHKFHGPKGAGILYVNANTTIKPLIDGGGQERSMRGGTENTQNIVGMQHALDIAIKEMDVRKNYIQELKTYFKSELVEKIQDIEFNGDQDQQTYSILSVSFPAGPKSDLLLMQLDISGISASGGSACTSGAELDSHVLVAIGHPAERKTIRFSFSHFNTKEELDKTVNLVQTLYPVTV